VYTDIPVTRTAIWGPFSHFLSKNSQGPLPGSLTPSYGDALFFKNYHGPLPVYLAIYNTYFHLVFEIWRCKWYWHIWVTWRHV